MDFTHIGYNIRQVKKTQCLSAILISDQRWSLSALQWVSISSSVEVQVWVYPDFETRSEILLHLHQYLPRANPLDIPITLQPNRTSKQLRNIEHNAGKKVPYQKGRNLKMKKKKLSLGFIHEQQSSNFSSIIVSSFGYAVFRPTTTA